MPELPEVETIVRELKKEVLNRTFVDVWTDNENMIKKPKSFNLFKKEIKGKIVKRIERRAKNILFYLSGGKMLLIHQKMTGHFLIGKWKREKNKWTSIIKGPILEDPMNRFLHLIFWLNNGKMLALTDLRKFAKAELWDEKEFKESAYLKSLGPEPLEKKFDYNKFKEVLERKRGKIKQVLLDQTVVAGIGNIYSDEILFVAKIRPTKNVPELSEKEKKNIYLGIKNILRLAIKLKGESFSDFRRTNGEKGFYDKARKVYRKEGEECPVCGEKIQRIKMGGRSAHFCPKCQK
ncbi:MAG: DNA-formamidopyrimidine glycosylase [Candidatus Nealsonbacteria bacterium]